MLISENSYVLDIAKKTHGVIQMVAVFPSNSTARKLPIKKCTRKNAIQLK